MSVKAIQHYHFKKSGLSEKEPHFAVSSVHLNTHCVVHQDEIMSHYKIYWIEDGHGVYQIDFKKVEIQGAGLLFLSPGQVLTIESEKVKSGYQISFDKEFYCVETHGKEIACNGVLFNNVHRATSLSLEPEDAPHFKKLIDLMIEEFENPGPAHREMLETYLRMFLIQALRKLDAQKAMPKKEETPTPGLVADFIALVEKHFRQTHSVAEYARYALCVTQITGQAIECRRLSHPYPGHPGPPRTGSKAEPPLLQ